ncbi:MAG TPA: alkaline phosphatase family protein [Terriglobales bacterium]|nr:alkaline phosphatase family protein [Terriglobales bacterium]
MATRLHRALLLLFAALLFAPFSLASAYDGRPRLIVIVIVDQFRGDFLERSRDRFGPGGFNLFLEHGAVFTDCRYDYANTHTAPGHATLLTGAYPDGHGIGGNQWWDPEKKKVVTSVEDERTQLLGLPGGPAKTGASPRKLLASTLGDVLKMATGGKSRVFAISLKDRGAVLPAGYAGDAAYWIDRQSGAFVTSTYYVKELPAWVKQFNESQHAEKYWNREWKDASGKTLGNTAPRKEKDGSPEGFFDVVGATPFANDYQLEFARELVLNEKLGSGPATDLLIVGLTAPDILGHDAGPDSPQVAAMVQALDPQLAGFFQFLGKQVGLANLWIALSADHGIAPLPSYASGLRIPAGSFTPRDVKTRANAALSSKLTPGQSAEFITALDWPFAYLSAEAFSSTKLTQGEAERVAGEALLKESPAVDYFTRSQIARGALPQDETGRRYAHSASPYGGWYVILVPQAYVVGYPPGTDHSSPYTYDTHVPLAFFGLPFQPGTYRGHAEPVDLAPTLASLLGISPPSHSTGRVLAEALTPAAERHSAPPRKAPR